MGLFDFGAYQDAGHHTPFTFKQSLIEDELDGACNGVIPEHLCPYGSSECITDRVVESIGRRSVKIVDLAINNMMFIKNP